MLRTGLVRVLTLLALVVAIAAGSRAFAADRVALVIGNGAYESEKPLVNPTNDSADVAAMLRKLGFEVIEARNLTKQGIERQTRDFRNKLKDASIALLYYAGHGMQVEGRNFILPVDAKIENAGDVKLEAVELDTIMEQMRAPDRINIVILDACRDNPFARTVSRSLGGATRAGQSAFGGLAEVKSSVGSVIVFATDPGNVALDGDGRNSPFTGALLRYIGEPGLEFSRLMKKVRQDVTSATQSRQVPWESTSLISDVYLAGEPTGQPVQQASLNSGISQARSLVQSREGGPQTGSGRQQPGPKPAPADDPALLCDRLTASRHDPLRRKDVPIVHNVDWERAIPACEKALAAAPTNLRFANQLGRAYMDARRDEDAVRVFRDAAERGSAFATANIGFLHYRGWGGMGKDYALARLWSEKAARMGVLGGMTNVAYMQARGIGGGRDPKEALKWYTRAAALGDPGPLVDYANALRSGWLGQPDDVKARELLEKAAAQDEPPAMTALAIYYQHGIGGTKDFEEARKWMEKAAASRDPLAMGQIGNLFRDGAAGFPRDFKLSREWFERAAKLNDANGHLGLALIYGRGEGVPKDLVEARRQFELAAGHDDHNAIRIFANWLLEAGFGSVEKEEARKWLTRAAEQDDEIARETLAQLDRPETPGEACDRLAAAEADPMRPPSLKAASDVSPDKAIPACLAAIKDTPGTVRYLNQLGHAYLWASKYDEALPVFQIAAEQKSSYAMLWLGNLHDRGQGTAKDQALSARWFQQAAELGSTDGMFNLAIAYLRGNGVEADTAKAREWFVKAAEAGSANAMYELGLLHYTGRGSPRDYTAAREWFEKAAVDGRPLAMRLLGDIYRNGYGIRQDLRMARQWYARASTANDTAAMQRLASLYIGGLGGVKETQKARGLLEQAAGADVPEAMVTLAQALLAGTFGEVEETEARKWLEKAASAGNATAKSMLAGASGAADGAVSHAEKCDRLASDRDDPLHSPAVPVPARIDGAQAIPACEAAVATAPNNLRFANQLGRAYLSQNRHFDAVRVFRSAAERGSAFAMLWMGNLYNRGMGVARDAAQAAVWYERAAESGLAVAHFNKAMVHLDSYLQGEKQPAQAALAIEWFEKAAALGHANAMSNLATMYERGQGVAIDDAKALEWMRKSADFGSARALNDLGYRHIQGKGVPRDHTKAREYLEQAIAGGLDAAYINLAASLIFSEGAERDRPRARKLLETAVEKQDSNAMVYLAEALNARIFGPQEPQQTRRLLRLAADLGNNRARELLAKMK